MADSNPQTPKWADTHRKKKPAAKMAIANVDHIAMTAEQLAEIDRTIPGLADYIRGWAAKAMDAEESARTDALTKLPNRLSLEEKAGAMMQEMVQSDRRSSEKHQHCTMVFIDTNDFGLINKAMGDSAGDIAIQSVGQFFKKALRHDDFIARKGGDEFILLMRCPEEDAQKRLQDLRKEFKESATKIFRKKLTKLIESNYPDLDAGEVKQMVSDRLSAFQKKLADKHENPALENADFTLSFSFGTHEITPQQVEHIDFRKSSAVSRALSGIMETADDTMRSDKAAHREAMKTSPMNSDIQQKLRDELDRNATSVLKS